MYLCRRNKHYQYWTFVGSVGSSPLTVLFDTSETRDLMMSRSISLADDYVL